MGLEHWLLVGVIELVLWIDTLSRSKLARLIPNLEELFSHPEDVLAVQDVTIGPARRYGSGGCMGLLVGLAGAVAALVALTYLVGPRPGRHPDPVVRTLVLGTPLLILLLSVLFMVRFFRGGSMVLTARGVELRYRATVVTCPWAVFNTPGQPSKPARDRLVLPVSARAVPLVEAWRDGAVIAAGADVKTYQWRLNWDGAAVLKDIYQVSDPLTLGLLLLELGRLLGR
jgi:hypothetical protein